MAEHDKDSYNSLPGPRCLPILGVGLRVMRQGAKYFLAINNKFGRIVRAPLPGVRSLFISDKDLIKIILAQTERNFTKGKHYKLLHRFSGLGLLNNSGPAWRSRRKTLNPLFGPGAFPQLGHHLDAGCAEFGQTVESAIARGEAVDVTAGMMQMMFGLLASLLFSNPKNLNFANLSRSFAAIQKYLSVALFAVVVPPLWVPTPRGVPARRALRILTTTVKGMIEERRKLPHPGEDMLGRLMQARDAETGEPISEKDIIDEVITFFFAGHDTTALAASYTFGFLAQNQEYVDKILHETDHLSDEELTGFADVRRDSVLRNVIFESMRLHPPLYAITRNNLETFTYKDLTFKPDTAFIISLISLHHDPEYWPDPDTFKPERFEGINFMTDARFIPFGGGPRMCIGPYLSMLELTGILVRVLRAYRPVNVANSPKLTASLTMIPEPYLQIQWQRRVTAYVHKDLSPAV